MAEIKVVRKGPNVWPWLIAAVVLVAAAVFWMNAGRVDDELDTASTSPNAARADAAGSSTATLPPAVATFVSFADTRPPVDVGPGHTYTSTGIDRLARAIDAVTAPDTGRDEALARQLEALREKSERLKADPSSTEHARLVRESFMSAADVLAAVQQRHLPDSAGARGHIEELRRSAEAVEAGTPLLNQIERVTAFFARASTTLQELARARRR